MIAHTELLKGIFRILFSGGASEFGQDHQVWIQEESLGHSAGSACLIERSQLCAVSPVRFNFIVKTDAKAGYRKIEF